MEAKRNSLSLEEKNLISETDGTESEIDEEEQLWEDVASLPDRMTKKFQKIMDNSVRERIKRNTISSSSPPSNFERKPVRSSTFNPPISDFQPSSPSSSSPEHSSEENSPGSSPTGSPKKITAFLDVPKSDSPKLQKKGALSPAMTGQQTIKVANVCVDLGKFQEALEIYNSKLEQDPSNLTLLNNKGIALDQLGQLKEAVENFNKVLEVNPNDSQTLFNASYALRKLGRIKEAIDCYDRVLEINPNNTEALNNKGLVLDQLGKFKQAIHYYELAISINPNHHIAIYNKGYALRMMGKFDEALEQYDKALDIDPAFADCWSNRALVLYNLRRIRLAIESYDKALQYNSKLYAAQHNKKICVKLLAESMEGKKCLYCRKAFGLLRKSALCPNCLIHYCKKECKLKKRNSELLLCAECQMGDVKQKQSEEKQEEKKEEK